MNVTIITDKAGKTFQLKNKICSFTFEKVIFKFFQKDTMWNLKIPHSFTFIKENEIKNGTDLIIANNSKIFHLYFYDYKEDAFQKYCTQEIIKIPNDIALQYPFILDCYINTKEKKIYTNNSFVLLNGQVIHNEISYKYGDKIEILNTIIYLFPSFIKINQSKEVHLKRYIPNYHILESIEPLNFNCIPWKDFNYEFDIKLDQFPIVEDNGKIPFIYSVGPMLTMSLAILMIAGFNILKSYNLGKEIVDLIPMMILPLSMLISSLIWIPLQRLNERKRKNKKEKKALDSYTDRIQWNIDQYESYKNNYLSYVKKYSTDFNHLMNCMNSNILNKFPIIPNLNIGYAKNRIVIKNPIQPFVFENNQIYQALKDTILKAEELPLLIDIYKYKSILFLNTDDLYIKYYILFIVCNANDKTKIIFRIHEDLLDKYYWIRNIANTYTNNKRNIYINDEISDFHNEKEYEYIIFELFVQHKQYSNKNEYCISFSKDEDSSFMCVIDYEKSRINDYLFNESYAFNKFEIHDFDINPIILKLCRISNNRKIVNTLFHLYDIGYIDSYNIEERWLENDINESLKCYIGMDKNEKIIIDLHEKKDGPHGLIAGTTGSGKSEFILTLILSLCLNYSPKDLQIILIDFKGGSTVQALNNGEYPIPHLVGSMTNLDGYHIYRSLEQMKHECIYRQKMFSKLSKEVNQSIANIQDYRRLYKEVNGLPYLAELCLIIDEFGELKRLYPNYLDELISISRIGRSLGIHLVLITQKVGGVVTDQILANTNFKICFKVSDKQDSYEILGKDSAYYLSNPGDFVLLKNHQMLYGKCAYSKAIYHRSKTEVQIVDHRLNVLHDSLQHLEHQETELNHLLKKLNQYQLKNKKMILNQSIQKITFEQLKNANSIGILDDFYNNKFIEYSIFNNQHEHYQIYAHKRNSIKNLLYALMYAINNHDNTTFIVIDSLSIFDMFQKISPKIHIYQKLKLTDKYQLLNYLRKKHKSNVILCITEYQQFIQDDYDFKKYFESFMMQASTYNITVLMFQSNVASIPYQLANMFKIKMCLGYKEKNELLQLFQHNIYFDTLDEYSCYIQLDKIFKMYYPKVTFEMLKEKYSAK